MQRPIIGVPPDFFKFLRVDWDIDWRGQSLGQTNDDMSPVVQNAFPRWIGSPEILLHGAALMEWRTMRLAAQGRLGLYRLELRDPILPPVPETHPDLVTDGVPFSTGVRFSTGQGFAYRPACTALTDAPAGAVELDLYSPDAAPRFGQIMSAEDWPFAVTWVQSQGDGNYTLGVQMPLRKAIAAGDLIAWTGTGIFEVSEVGAGRMSYGLDRASSLKLSFQEVLMR